MKDVRIVRIGVHEIELGWDALQAVHGYPSTRQSAELFQADSNCYHFVAEEGGRAVGSCYGYALRYPYRAEPQFLLYELDVLESHRSRGIGQALIRAFIDVAREAGACEAWVITNASNAPAMRAYQACGMRRINSDDVMLEISL